MAAAWTYSPSAAANVRIDTTTRSLGLPLGGRHGCRPVVAGDADAGIQGLVGPQAHVPGAGAPVLVGHPAQELFDELVEVVRAPLGEGAAGTQAGVLLAELAAVLEPGRRVGGAPDDWVVRVAVVGRAIPPDERAVDPAAVDAQGAAVLELALA
jgi:hypothetical protein